MFTKLTEKQMEINEVPKKSGVLINCLNCGKEFYITYYQTTIQKGFYCSKQCMEEHNKPKNNATCPICNKSFYINPLRIKRNTIPICCSKKCDSKRREVNFLGIENSNFGNQEELNPIFKSDVGFSNFGYLLVRNMEHPFKNAANFVFFHRLVMEEYLKNCEPDSPFLVEVKGQGLFLDPNVVIYHKNKNKLDNRLSNLAFKNVHSAYHNSILNKNPKYKKLIKEADLPVKKYFRDAGQDLTSIENLVIHSQQSRCISTGISIEIPEGHVGLIWSRSGLSIKNRIEVGAGCIDETYRGEIKVHLYNFSTVSFQIKKGDKIAQLLIIPVNLEKFIEIESLSSTERGENGFGSTDKK